MGHLHKKPGPCVELRFDIYDNLWLVRSQSPIAVEEIWNIYVAVLTASRDVDGREILSPSCKSH